MSKSKTSVKNQLSEYDKKKINERFSQLLHDPQKSIFIDRCMNITWQIDEILLNHVYARHTNEMAQAKILTARGLILEAAALAGDEPVTKAIIDKDKIR